MKITREEVLIAARQPGRCEVCQKFCPDGRDPHHIDARGMGGGNRNDSATNIIALCRQCHQDVDWFKLTMRECEIIAADREGVPVEWLRECRWLIQRLDNDISPEQLEQELEGGPGGFKALVRREVGYG